MAKWAEFEQSPKNLNVSNILQKKVVKQRKEIARLTEALGKAVVEKNELLEDLKWLKGQK
tara:strand:- start:2988 stop:3167 length:180 start_codon:yes stop_codon:yes gene_type:complete